MLPPARVPAPTDEKTDHLPFQWWQYLIVNHCYKIAPVYFGTAEWHFYMHTHIRLFDDFYP